MIARIVLGIVAAALIAGCASHRQASASFGGPAQVTISYSDRYGLAQYENHPCVEGSINGISGLFVLDTGAPVPALTMKAVRRCGIPVYASRYVGAALGSNSFRLKEASNVVVRLTPSFAIHWSRAMVLPEDKRLDTNFFGIIDYHTLRSCAAVVDMKEKTITFTP